MKTITESEAKAMLGQVRWWDVRAPGEYRAEHIEGTENVPLDVINRGGEGPIVLSCLSGKLSEAAAGVLEAQGHLDVYSLSGGIEAWKAAGFSTIKGSGTISIERQVRIAAGTLVAAFSILGLTVHSGFFGVPIFVGCGLVFAGVTDTCGMGLILARMPWNR